MLPLQTLIDLNGRFVSVNPMQQRKDVSMEDPFYPPVQLLPMTSDREIQRAITNRLDFFPPGESVFVIGRIRSDVYALGYGSGAFIFSRGDKNQFVTVEVTYRTWNEDAGERRDIRLVGFLTAHSLRGSEADNVFLIADRNRGGFPNTVSDDISDLFEMRVKGISDAEECRVFYVAMTRAKRGYSSLTVQTRTNTCSRPGSSS